MVDVALSRGTGLLPRKILFKKGRRENDGFQQISTSKFKILNGGEKTQHTDRTKSNDSTSSYALCDESDISELMSWNQVSRIGSGLVNLGNTCFLNALLQCLTHTAPLANYAQKKNHSKTCQIKNSFCLFCVLESHIVRALSSSGASFPPKQIVSNLKNISKNFRFGRQEDSHEFLRYVIEGLQNSSLRGINLKMYPKIAETTVPSRIFGGQLLSRVTCSQCGFTSDTVDPFLDLSLDIKGCNSLERVFQRFTAPEILDKDNKYKCSKCAKLVRATKQFTIKKTPNILTIQLKRFAFHSFGGKLDNMINFPQDLDIKPYVTPGEVNENHSTLYHLYGVLVHFGHTSNSGHYLSYVKSSAGIWYCMDDSQVQQVSLATVLKQKAYILFYIRDVPKNKRKREEKTPDQKLKSEPATPEKNEGKKPQEMVQSSGDKEIKKRKIDPEEEGKANGKIHHGNETPNPKTPPKPTETNSPKSTTPQKPALTPLKTPISTETNPTKSKDSVTIDTQKSPSQPGNPPPKIKIEKNIKSEPSTPQLPRPPSLPNGSSKFNSESKQRGAQLVQILSANDREQYSSTVPSWESAPNEVVASKEKAISEILSSEKKRKEIDEWDQAYDQGRVKKVRKKENEKKRFPGNSFQRKQDFFAKLGKNRYLFNNNRGRKIRKLRRRV